MARQDFDPSSLYDNAAASVSSHVSPTSGSTRRPPPSSFPYPFQAYPGNPDPLPPRHSLSARSSNESFVIMSPGAGGSLARSNTDPFGDNTGMAGADDDDDDLPPPLPPFMRTRERAGSDSGMSSASASSSPPHLYRNSVGAAIQESLLASNIGGTAAPGAPLPRNASMTFRAPFLSPASRPGSQIWTPPAPVLPNSPSASSTALSLNVDKPVRPSTRIPQKLTNDDKPWVHKRTGRERASWWITLLGALLGVAAAAVLCYFGIQDVHVLDDAKLCLLMDEDWSSGISEDRWVREAGAGGWGNGEFQVFTAEDQNSFVRDGDLYILPTLMSDAVGRDDVFDGGEYHVNDCLFADSNRSACDVSSDAGSGAVLPPALSARLSTNGKVDIDGGAGGGKVEVRAKLPRGDWLWPAIWMLPTDANYGEWPRSGEIDIMEARGNQLSYPGQGSNFVRSSLNYGPMDGLIHRSWGWWQMKRKGFDKDFHTYTFEWTSSFMRFSVDSKLQAMLTVGIDDGKNSFWERGDFPQTSVNTTAGSSGEEVVVPNPWSGRSGMAPYDQKFYLIMSVAVGGTSGWFPDNLGNKPWADSSRGAMSDFAHAQDSWSVTWPSSEEDRAMRVRSVKMWQMCG